MYPHGCFGPRERTRAHGRSSHPLPFASPGCGDRNGRASHSRHWRGTLGRPKPAPNVPPPPAPGRPSAQIRASLDTVSFPSRNLPRLLLQRWRPEVSPRPQVLGERYPTGVSCAKLGGPARALRCGRTEVVTYGRGASGAGARTSSCEFQGGDQAPRRQLFSEICGGWAAAGKNYPPVAFPKPPPPPARKSCPWASLFPRSQGVFAFGSWEKWQS